MQMKIGLQCTLLLWDPIVYTMNILAACIATIRIQISQINYKFLRAATVVESYECAQMCSK